MYIKPRILIIGNSTAGKSTVGGIIADHLDTRHTSTSQMIVDEFATARRMSTQDVWHLKASRAGRNELFNFANRRKHETEDPAHFALKALEHGHVVDGVRTRTEFAAARAHFDLCLWKCGGEPNATDCVPRECADYEIPNFDGDWRVDMADWVPGHVHDWLATPNGYVAGLYSTDSTPELRRARAQESAEWACRLRELGLRAFDPIGTFLPLDDWWADPAECYWRIIELCKVQCARFRHRDYVLLRPDWRESRGAGLELEFLRQNTERIAYAEAGIENVRHYLTEMAG